MLWSFCSSKGGVGTSVVAAAFAHELAARSGELVLLVDVGGDQADICGVDVTGAPGLADWLYSSDEVGVSALKNLLIDVAPGLALLPRGTRPIPEVSGSIDPARCALMIEGFASMVVVADVGVVDIDPLSPKVLLLAGSDRTVTVLRACYLALRQLGRLPVVVDAVVEVVEAGRSLRTLDIEAVAGVPVSARIRVDPTIARAVDAGLLLRRTPRPLRRAAEDLRSAFAELSLEGVRR